MERKFSVLIKIAKDFSSYTEFVRDLKLNKLVYRFNVIGGKKNELLNSVNFISDPRYQ